MTENEQEVDLAVDRAPPADTAETLTVIDASTTDDKNRFSLKQILFPFATFYVSHFAQFKIMITTN